MIKHVMSVYNGLHTIKIILHSTLITFRVNPKLGSSSLLSETFVQLTTVVTGLYGGAVGDTSHSE